MKAVAVAEFLDVHRATVYRLARNGVIPFINVGNTMRFDLQAVLEALETGQDELSGVPAAQ